MKVHVTIIPWLFLLATPVMAQTAANSKPLTAKPGEKWILRWNRSDDFNGKKIDWRKWNRTPEKFGAWTWDNDSNTSVANGHLTITIRHRPSQPTKGGRDKGGSPYTSGMLKSYATGTYGYYEARIKAAPLFPGVCPAFWLYSRIDDSLIRPGEVRYSEIDIVELTQRGNQKKANERMTDHNLHTILSNGKPGIAGRQWRRPNDARFQQSQAIEYKAPFDPRLDFHTYGCKVMPETIVWYVDGREVGRKKNTYWHRKMNVALSLGLRPPYAKFERNRLVPDKSQPANGFPTSMVVDYVRVWELDKQP